MSLPEPLHGSTLARLREALERRELTAPELVEHHVERIAELDGSLHAFTYLCGDAVDQAREAQRARDAGDPRPLLGIPFAVKDVFDVEGVPTAAGTEILRDNVAESDSSAVRRLRDAGMVLVGKTHTVQLAYGGAGVNHTTGTPKNPWSEVHHLPGGSSSGSGVAAAAGLVPLALGTDTGGSVRLPAALCGLTGLKTTVGRVSRAGVYPLSWSLDSVGPLVRSAEDAALVLSVLAGPDPDDSTTWGRPRFAAETGASSSSLRGLRLAFAESIFFDDVEPEVEAAVRDSGAVLRDLGARVDSLAFTEASSALDLNPRGLVIAAEAFSLNRELLENRFDELDPVVAERMIEGRDVTIEEYFRTVRAWQELRVRAYRALEGVDALLCPTAPIPARPLEDANRDMETYFSTNFLYLRNTSIGNILDLCAVSVPCGFTEAGLPIGLTIYGRPFEEARVLRIAHGFQSATAHHCRRPDLSWARSEAG